LAQSTETAGTPPVAGRIALLIGNRDYPGGQDLPPITKNVRDVHLALEKRGFVVTDALDADRSTALRLVDSFAQQLQKLPEEGVALFYFSGHGIQVNAENVLVSAHIDPVFKNTVESENIVKNSVALFENVLKRMPNRQAGLNVAVIDACRTSIRATSPASDGLNQVEAPAGSLIAFSTGAGRPALAPADENRNTFYTESLVKILTNASDETSFADMFRLVKIDVQTTMLSHPIEAVRKLAQFPFIAENSHATIALATTTRKAKRFQSADEEGDWAKLTQSGWAPEIYKLADEFLQRYPNSPLAGGALVARDGASEAARILSRSDIRLFRSSFLPQPDLGDAYAKDLAKAARGDKDAAARVGRQWQTKATSGPEALRYEAWMQYSAELGNGIASYELALHYRRIRQPQPAAKWEDRARELGYTPPPSLDNVRK